MRIIGFAGWSGAGKTTLLAKVIPLLVGRGMRVSTLKHAHHAFDVDIPGKDSHTHRLAGASEVLVSSKNRIAFMHELRGSEEWSLGQLLGMLGPADVVLVEGFKKDPHPKIEVFRAANGKPALYPGDATIRMIASDTAFPDAPCPVVDINNINEIADAILAYSEAVDSYIVRGV